jgi:hypothetical protein
MRDAWKALIHTSSSPLANGADAGYFEPGMKLMRISRDTINCGVADWTLISASMSGEAGMASHHYA